MLLNIAYDQAVRCCNSQGIANGFLNPFKSFFLLELIAFFKVSLFFKNADHNIIQIKYDNLETFHFCGILLLNVFHSFADFHFMFGSIIEYIVPDFIAESFVLTEGRFSDFRFRLIKSFFQCIHINSLL